MMEDYEYSYIVADQTSLIELVNHFDGEEIKKRLLELLKSKRITNIQYNFIMDILKV